MSHIKLPAERLNLGPAGLEDGGAFAPHLEPDARLLLQMASLLGPRDRIALSHIIRRVGELCATDGEDVALAVLDQIEAILVGRRLDA